MKKIQNTLLGAAMALASFQAAALPFAGVDARSLAMGGTGVAAGSIANASTFNPALLAASREGEDFNFSVAVGVLARDEADMVDAIDTITATNNFNRDLVDQFSFDVNTYIANVTPANGVLVQNSATALTAALDNLSNKPLEVGANLGVNVTIPSETFGISVFANSRVIAAGSVNVDAADTAAINQVVTDVIALNPTADPFTGTDLASTLTLNGGAVTEVGVALATKIFGIAIGVTPKQVRVDTIESTQGVNAVDTGNILDDTGETFTDVNFDIGVALDLGAFKIGAVGKNMIPQEYALAGSAQNSKVVLEPQLRAGIAFDAGWVTLTMDQDLTENKGVISNAAIGDSLNSQYTSMGVEFDMSLVQIRAGMRSDNTGNSEDVFTAGIGIHALVSVDVAVAGNDQGVEAIIQAGLRW